jgi:hypothetical protein
MKLHDNKRRSGRRALPYQILLMIDSNGASIKAGGLDSGIVYYAEL